MSGLDDMELPAGWAWARLGDVAVSVKNGIYVSRPGRVPDGVPILRISAVRPMHLSTSDLRYTGMSLDEVKAKDGIVKPGDLLFTRYNGNIMLVGACARVPDGTPKIAYPDKLIRVSLPAEIDSRFLCYAWAWAGTQEQLRQHVKTTAGQAGISGSSLKRIELPIPPLREQRRIVETLEDHLSRLDEALSIVASCRKRAETLLPRVMKAELCQRDTPVVRLGEVSEVRLGRQRSPKNHSGSQMRPYLRAANVGWQGLLLDDVKEMNFSDKEAEIYRLHAGDIVLSEASGSPGEVGKPAIWNTEIDDCCFQNTLIRVRPLEKVEPKFLLYWLRSEALSGSFRKGARGVGIHHLGAAKISAWQVPLPPRSEQVRIVEVLEEKVTRLDNARSLLDGPNGVSARAMSLREALLSRALTGQLVTQAPTDEPASVLLKRIHAERSAQSGKGKIRPSPRRARKATTPTDMPPPPPAASTTPAPTDAVQQELPL